MINRHSMTELYPPPKYRKKLRNVEPMEEFIEFRGEMMDGDGIREK